MIGRRRMCFCFPLGTTNAATSAFLYRLEAFSDGVIAIITIMALEMKVPHAPDIEALYPVIPVFLSYLLSFIYLGIYWNNHHHMLQTCRVVTGSILWSNLHLLFWLSLIPDRRIERVLKNRES